MSRTERKEARERAPFRQATALAASVSLLVPGLVPPAFAQNSAEIVAACEAEFADRPNRLERCLTERGAAPAAEAQADVESEEDGDAADAEGNREAGAEREGRGDRDKERDRTGRTERASEAEAAAESDAPEIAEEPVEPAEPEMAEDPAASAEAVESDVAETGQVEEAPADGARKRRNRDTDEAGEDQQADGAVDEERARQRPELEGQDGNEAEALRADEDATGDADTAETNDRDRDSRKERREAGEGNRQNREERRNENDSAIADEVASKPEPELTERQRRARDQASRALEQLQSGGGVAAAATDDAAAAEVEEQTIGEEDVRTSSEDFETEAVVTENDDDDDDDDDDRGLSGGAKLALGALGALAVGTVLANRSRVVSNSGDRVVVQQDDGALQVFKDDDALLRQSGDDVRTERFDDGSTRTTVTRPDGSRIVTIRDASLRVLRRDRIDPDGTRYTLIDDTEVAEPVDVATLPEPIVSSRSGASDDPLRDALEREAGIDRRFSLAQVRNISEVRALAPAYEVDTVTFASGSAAISPEQAANLTSLAREVLGAIRENPKEVFLIEGHTDAVGDAAYNLALSDRRAETLALALNEYFDVPVENMVVQGYGEEFLKVSTLEAEQANRRATVRQITGLLRTAAAN
ncbi:OmpA family protein [uncultured Jannaschia sp.]|uniref:OmpA family protein n=1 Tax=uncultured Jannaschia sp. TaxID=293347 RepID=UPI00261AE6CD|nr:OmpA family protein [uncultured Jannaschia sp.]